MGNFKRGLILGGLLGAGLAWLNVTTKGKAVRDEALEHAAVVYERVKKEVMKSDGWKKMKKSEVTKQVQKIANDYSAEIGLAKSTVMLIVSLVLKKWEKMKHDGK